MKKPLATFKMYNHWTPSRHRLLLKYDLSQIPGGIPPVPLSVKPAGSEPGAGNSRPRMLAPAGGIALIQRLDDDRILAHESQTGSYVSEPLRPLLERLRFDPWKKIAPRLSRQSPPELSPEQRTRLAEEVRALLSPLRRRMQRTYFRELERIRTFNGIRGRGYRLTQLVNVGGMGPGQGQWMRTSYEWWLAGDLEGDDTIRQFAGASRDHFKGLVWPTTSMWINELLKLSPYLQDDDVRQAMRTLMPTPPSPRAGFGGTPLRFYATMKLPPLQRAAMGDVRVELALARRETTPVPERVFEAPIAYEQIQLEPYLRRIDPILNGELIDRLYKGQPVDDLFEAMGQPITPPVTPQEPRPPVTRPGGVAAQAPVSEAR